MIVGCLVWWGRNSDLVSGSEKKGEHAHKNREQHRIEQVLLYLLAERTDKKTQKRRRTRRFLVGCWGVGRAAVAGKGEQQGHEELEREKSAMYAAKRHTGR